MKYISFTIPAYNSANYLNKCVDSLLVAGNDCEIIIVNDGSKDSTLSIANHYHEAYPEIVKVIDKPNGGHGSGINAGLSIASGLYFKVVDSDDWLDETTLKLVLSTIKQHHQNNIDVDMYITNFTYAHQFEGTTIRDYSKQFPHNQVFGWNQSKRFKYSMTLMMHSLIHKTDTLRKSKVVLPEHTFYVDNIFVYTPLPYMVNLYYMPVSLYQYYIGRVDQSVTLQNISRNYKQQIKVMEWILDTYSSEQLSLFPSKLRHYMYHHMSAIMMITQMFAVSRNEVVRKVDLQALWNHLKRNDKKLFYHLRFRSYNAIINFLPWKLKGFLMVKGYLYFKKKYKLG